MLVSLTKPSIGVLCCRATEERDEPPEVKNFIQGLGVVAQMICMCEIWV